MMVATCGFESALFNPRRAGPHAQIQRSELPDTLGFHAVSSARRSRFAEHVETVHDVVQLQLRHAGTATGTSVQL
jgi:hypothetical protein